MKVILEIQAVDRCDKKCWNADKFATRNKNHKFNKLVFMSIEQLIENSCNFCMYRWVDCSQSQFSAYNT
jgi:hypothetical protein